MGFLNLGATISQVGINSIQKPSVLKRSIRGIEIQDLALNKLDTLELKDSMLVPESKSQPWLTLKTCHSNSTCSTWTKGVCSQKGFCILTKQTHQLARPPICNSFTPVNIITFGHIHKRLVNATKISGYLHT